ncbi:hypothetical protein GGU11DRAFT_156517 [Lentinula aff. detonsa]|nr:hypothetical protein GGU11DRAFT_156517 [Lentinula aff. detonsa]
MVQPTRGEFFALLSLSSTSKPRLMFITHSNIGLLPPASELTRTQMSFLVCTFDSLYPLKSHIVPGDDLTSEIADRQLFMTNGINNLDVFTLPDHKHNRIKNRMIKIVNISEQSAACERYALQSFHEYFRTGFAIIDEQKVGVIITSMGGNGASMRRTTWWKDLSLDHKSYALNSTRKVVQEMVFEFLLEGKPLYANFSPDHVLIDNNQEIHLIDFGYPGVRPMKLLPKPDEYEKWFQRRWYFLWEDVYREARAEIPVEHLWRKSEPERNGPTNT